MNHSVKRRRQALHQTRHQYYLNISVEAANLSDWRIESNRKSRFSSENRIESNRIEPFRPNWNALQCRVVGRVDGATSRLSNIHHEPRQRRRRQRRRRQRLFFLRNDSLWSRKQSVIFVLYKQRGSVAEWLACWTQAQKGPGSNRSRDAVG